MFQKIKKILIAVSFLMILTLGFVHFSFALSTKQKALILENHKKEQYELLFESDSELLGGDERNIFNVTRKMNIYGDIKEKVSNSIDLAEYKKDKAVEKITSLQAAIDSLEEDIDQATKDITKVNSKIVETKVDIESNKKQITFLRSRINDSREIILYYLVSMYKKGNYISDDTGIDNLKSIIISGEDIGDVIDDLHFKGIMQVTGTKLIENHKSYVRDLYIEKVQLEKYELELKGLRKSEIIARKVLNDKKEFKDRIMSVTKGQQALYKKYITDKMKIEKELKLKELKEKIKFKNIRNSLLDKYSCDYVDIRKESEESLTLTGRCLDINKIIYSESQLKGIKDDDAGNVFNWPIMPTYGVSAYYKGDAYKAEFGVDHDAVDIVAPQGSYIRAPADGYVMYVEPPTDNGYSYLALKHSDGYVTVYGHLSEINVDALDFVKKGKIFGRTGGEFGTKGSGIMTTGPHLHFEVFRDKTQVDPLNYIDISILPFSELPSKYEYKFKMDFKKRKGYEYKNKELEEKSGNKFVLKGDSEIERQKYLLTQYAVGGFKNWNTWVEESLSGDIDPTFVMCIGLAETGLGNHLKTKNNVGNVGNTDSGGTWDFDTPRAGIYWIVKTLNNKYFESYNSISKLSRYGNKTGSIYASSSDNWHNNIIKCMSHIKGKYIEDNHNFRIIR